MKERGLIFSAPMVRALLAGTKTQTRRPVGPPIRVTGPNPPGLFDCYRASGPGQGWYGAVRLDGRGSGTVLCPYGVHGSRLWVREEWSHNPDAGANCDDHRCGIQGHIRYRASEDLATVDTFAGSARWRPSIYMPRWASRITLELTDVRLQQLQEISEEDARAEGVTLQGGPCDHPDRPVNHRAAVQVLWESINGKRAPWSDNPWVWALTFRVVA